MASCHVVILRSSGREQLPEPSSDPFADGLKVLLVADLNFYSKGHTRQRVLEDAGAHVTALSHSPLGGDDAGFVPLTFQEKVMTKLGLPPDRTQVNKRMLEAAKKEAPDLVWIEKGMMIKPSTLRSIKRLAPQARIVWYSEDDMALAHNQSRGFVQSLRLYDTIITTKNSNINPGELPAQGARSILLVDKAFDPYQHLPVPVTTEEEAALGGDVGFVGTFETDRAEKLLVLAQSGVSVRIWGNGWEDFASKDENLRIENAAVVNTADDFRYTKTICATKINMGFLRKLNRDTQTDRTMEIPACGAFMMAERTEDHVRLFDEGQEAEFFEGNEEMITKVRRYLDADSDEQRQSIAQKARLRCQESGYSETDRLPRMVHALLTMPR